MEANGSTLDTTQLAAIVSHLSGQRHVAAAYLLGSAAEGRLRPDSDVDIAVLPVATHGLPLADRLSLAAELSRIAGRELALGVLTNRNLVYANEAVTGGRLIFDGDHSATATFEMTLCRCTPRSKKRGGRSFAPMPPDDILINTAAIIERCVRRMLEEVRACPLLDD